MAEQARPRGEAITEEGRTDLAEFADRDQIDVLGEPELLKGKQPLKPAKGLHLVDKDGHASLPQHGDDRRKEGGATRVAAAFALHQFQAHHRMATGVPGQVALEHGDCPLGAVCRSGGIEERHIVDGEGQRQAVSIGRLVGDAGHGQGPAHEAPLEGEHSVGWMFFLQGNLDRVFVGHRPAG